ncbi:MAG: hypothetical protein V2I43_19190 [Parvularcula sp.]|jgi:hypothetical protein|nr:hypothetical protein [Parvularcula sp.]
MAPPGEKDLTLTIYGLDAQGSEVDADVFAAKLKKVVSALRRLDQFYNVSGQHRFMIRNLEFASATVWLREKQIKSKRVRRSPSRKFAEIGAQVASGGTVKIENSADEYALSAYVGLSKGAGRTFSYGIVEAPEVTPVRIDGLLERRVKEIITSASAEAEAAPQKYFRGTAIETYDGVVKAVDLRGLFPEAKLVLSAGKKQISCIVDAKDIEQLRVALDNRALVTGRAQHDGKRMLPERIDVIEIRPLSGGANVLSLKGAMKNLDADPMRGLG